MPTQILGHSPDVYNGLYVTSFSPHYDGRARAQSGEWLSVVPAHARTASKFDLIPRINHALDRCGLVPEIGFDGQIVT